MLGESEGKHQGDLTRMRTESNPYKITTPPSTQNLKALGLWVFFLICCSTFSFLPNVGLRLTLEYLTILPLDPTLHHIDTLPLERKHSQPEYITYDPSLVPPFTHLNGTRLPETSSGRLSIQGQTVLAQAVNQRL